MIDTIIINLFTIHGYISLLEIFLIAIEVVYAIIAFIILRAVKLMNESFKTGASTIFTFFALAHFLIAIVVVLLSILFI